MFVYYLNYSVLNTLSEYTYFYISKNITSYTFVAYSLTYLLTGRFLFYILQVPNVSGTTIFECRFTVIYRHLLSKCSDNAVLGSLEMGHCNVFSDTNQKHVFVCIAGVYIL